MSDTPQYLTKEDASDLQSLIDRKVQRALLLAEAQTAKTKADNQLENWMWERTIQRPSK